LRCNENSSIETSGGLQLADDLRTGKCGDRASQTVDVDLAGESEVGTANEKGRVANSRAVICGIGKVLTTADRIELRDDREGDGLQEGK
jgi:hypothetical protein